MAKYFYELSLWEEKPTTLINKEVRFTELKVGTEIGINIDGVESNMSDGEKRLVLQSYIPSCPERDYGPALELLYYQNNNSEPVTVLLGIKSTSYPEEGLTNSGPILSNKPDGVAVTDFNFSAKRQYIYSKTKILKDNKLEQLGSHDSTFEGSAFDITITKNINGMNTLSFSLFKQYYDWKQQKIVDNPLVEKLYNRSLVRLKYKKAEDDEYKWYSFVINEKEESHSDGKLLYTYSCQDAIIDELSRTGYNLSFDEESVNAQGTIDELAMQVLKDTDWQYIPALVDEKGEDTGQFVEKLSHYVIEDGQWLYKEEIVEQNISEYNPTVGTVVYRYKYRKKDEENEGNNDINWNTTYQDSTLWGYDISKIITGSTFRNMLYNGKNYTDTTFWSVGSGTPDTSFKGELRPSANLNTIVKFEEENDLVESFGLETETSGSYFESLAKMDEDYYGIFGPYSKDGGPFSIITNSSLKNANIEFVGEKFYVLDLEGVAKTNNININNPKAPLCLFAWLSTSPITYPKVDVSNLLTINLANYNQYPMYIQDEVTPLDGKTPFHKRIIFKCKKSVDGAYLHIGFPTYSITNNKLTIDKVTFNKIQVYEALPLDEKQSILDLFPYFNNLSINVEGLPKYTKYPATGERNYFLYYTESDLKDQNSPINKLYQPEDFIEPMVSNQLETQYFYQEDGKNKYISLIGYETEKMKLTGNDSKKVRILSVEKSNRFNILQSLAELFEGYIQYNILYNEDGSVKRNNLGIQQRFITFTEKLGREVSDGFHYGVNLSSISRNINSEKIVSKLWVEKSESSVTSTGLVAIEDSQHNTLGQPFIYNLNYYLDKGIIDKNTYLDHYSNLENTLKPLIEEYNSLSQSLNKIKDQILNYDTKRENLINNISAQKAKIDEYMAKIPIRTIYNVEYYTSIKGTYYIANASFIGNYLPSNIEDTYANAKTAMGQLDLFYEDLISINQQIGYQKYQDGYDEFSENADYHINDTSYPLGPFNDPKASNAQTGKGLFSRYNAAKKQVEDNLKEQQAALKEFENTYSKYITDGSWSDNTYTDSDRYYCDAWRVLENSSNPEVSYTIDLIDSETHYEVGDKTFITDIDFFGYDSFGRPWQEDMVISEISETLDAANETTITVQNYRSDFEDLFSKISATVQTVQLKDGIYSRAGNFTPDGQISADILQKTLSENIFELANSTGNTFSITTNGAQLTNFNNNKKVRLIADGIFISPDGNNWTTALTADGLNASIITTGVLNTKVLNIYNNDIPSFSWDYLGISAYRTYTIDEANLIEKLEGGFVRYDQHGLYFVNSEKDQSGAFTTRILPNTNRAIAWYNDEEKIKPVNAAIGISWADRIKYVQDNSDVSLTWNGLLIKSQDGAVEISTEENSIKVLGANGEERIFLGLKKEYGENKTDYYGILINNTAGDPVFIADEDGNLSITGDIHATSGKFTGEINATSGTIGSIFLDTIENETGAIYAINDDNRVIWKIDGSGSAHFENAYINGTLASTRFKANEVQTSSGTILIRPATKILAVSTTPEIQTMGEIPGNREAVGNDNNNIILWDWTLFSNEIDCSDYERGILELHFDLDFTDGNSIVGSNCGAVVEIKSHHNGIEEFILTTGNRGFQYKHNESHYKLNLADWFYISKNLGDQYIRTINNFRIIVYAPSASTLYKLKVSNIKIVNTAINYEFTLEENIEVNKGDYICVQSNQDSSQIASGKYYGFVDSTESYEIKDEETSSIKIQPKIKVANLYERDIYSLESYETRKVIDIDAFESVKSYITNGTFINFGGDAEPGIVINAATEKVFGPGETITFYKNKNKAVPHEEVSEIDHYLEREYTTILGRLDEVGYIGEYGLYSDNAILKGSMIIDEENYEQLNYNKLIENYYSGDALTFSFDPLENPISLKNAFSYTLRIQLPNWGIPPEDPSQKFSFDIYFLSKRGGVSADSQILRINCRGLQVNNNYSIILNKNSENDEISSLIKNETNSMDSDVISEVEIFNTDLLNTCWGAYMNFSFTSDQTFWYSASSDLTVTTDTLVQRNLGLTTNFNNNNIVMWLNADKKGNQYIYNNASFYITGDGYIRTNGIFNTGSFKSRYSGEFGESLVINPEYTSVDCSAILKPNFLGLNKFDSKFGLDDSFPRYDENYLVDIGISGKNQLRLGNIVITINNNQILIGNHIILDSETGEITGTKFTSAVVNSLTS